MGRPVRLDNPKKITLSLSAVCHAQLDELCAHFEAEPNRRTAVARSEVVEQAVAALYAATSSRSGRAKK